MKTLTGFMIMLQGRVSLKSNNREGSIKDYAPSLRE